MKDAFTSWEQMPLVGTIEDAARALNTSVRTIRRRLARGEHVPGVMPRRGQEPWQFSKQALQRYLDGGYVRVMQRKGA